MGLDVLHRAFREVFRAHLNLSQVLEVLGHAAMKVLGLVAGSVRADHEIDFIFHLAQQSVGLD